MAVSMAGIEGDFTTPRDRSQDPGPINLARSAGQLAYGGIPSFMGVPVCLTQEDLRAGKVDVAILGAPVDMSAGMRGAAFGPRHIRCDERVLPQTPQLLLNPTTLVRPFEVLSVVDYGDAPPWRGWPGAPATAALFWRRSRARRPWPSRSATRRSSPRSSAESAW